MRHPVLIATVVAFAAACSDSEPEIASFDEARGAATEASPAEPSPTARSGYVEAGGIAYYYAVHGQGEPLLLLHGGLGSSDMFAPQMPILAGDRQVITVDLHGHGRTELGQREFDWLDMGEDMATLLSALGHEQVDVLGYSFGAGVAFRLAAQHPERVRRLALVSAAFARDGFYPEILAQQAQVNASAADAMQQTPMYQTYAAVAPHPEDFPRLLDRMGDLMRQPYDWSADVQKLTMPVLLVYGDSDMFLPEHVIEFYQLLGGGLRDAGWGRENMARNRLAILPDLTHYEIFMAPELARTALTFLDGVSQPPVWTGPETGNETASEAAAPPSTPTH